MKILFFVLGCAFLCLVAVSCIRTESEIKPIEIKPIQITLNINVRIEKELDDFFSDIDELE